MSIGQSVLVNWKGMGGLLRVEEIQEMEKENVNVYNNNNCNT